MTAAQKKITRTHWIDVARALCIILVVIGHAIDGSVDAHLASPDGLWANTGYLIYTFHMAAFFVLSGLVVQSSVEKNPEKFTKNLFLRIAYPYFLWASIQICTINVFSSVLNHPFPFEPKEFLNLVWGNVSQFWFLKALFIIHVIYLALRKHLDNLSFLLLFLALRGCTELFELPGTMAQICGFGIFYALGLVFSKQAMNWRADCRRPILWALGLGCAWTVFAATSLQSNEPVIAGDQLRGSLLPASITGCLFIFALAGTKYLERSKFLQYIGQRTLPVYLLHIFFVAGTRILFTKILHVTDVAVIVP